MNPDGKRFGFARMARAGGLVAMAISGPLLAGLLSANPAGKAIAAVFPPWWDASETFVAAASAGEPVSAGRFAWLIIVRGDPDGLAGRLRAAGALVLLHPAFATWCGSGR